MIYERGRAPTDAPVTWTRLDPLGPECYSLFAADGLLVEVRTQQQAHAICRAFHLAELAKYARVPLGELARHGATYLKEVDQARGWCHRYDQLKHDP
jgi:hypothetical protein